MSLTVQFYTMVAMVGMGLWLGIAMETYGRFMHPNRLSWVLFFNDLLFWAVQACLIFYVLLQVNNGEIRLYVFLALLCGFAMYKALFEKGYQRVLTKMIRVFKTIVTGFKQLVIVFFIRPVTVILKVLWSLGMMIGQTTFRLLTAVFSMLFLPIRIPADYLGKKFKIRKQLEGIHTSLQNMYKRCRKWFKK